MGKTIRKQPKIGLAALRSPRALVFGEAFISLPRRIPHALQSGSALGHIDQATIPAQLAELPGELSSLGCRSQREPLTGLGLSGRLAPWDWKRVVGHPRVEAKAVIR